MKKTHLILAALLAIANIAYADGSEKDRSAAVFTENVLKPAMNKILMLSKAKDIDPETKAKQYNDIIFPLFNYNFASKLTLGKDKWESLTRSQKDRFEEVYGKRLQRFYINRILLLYPDADILFVNTVQKKNRAVVMTEMKSQCLGNLFHRSWRKWRQPEKQWIKQWLKLKSPGTGSPEL